MTPPESKSWGAVCLFRWAASIYLCLPTAVPDAVATQVGHRPTSQPHAPINELGRFGAIADDTYTSGGTPNADTVYAWGILDVSREPVVITHPGFGDRYFVFELADWYGDNFAYIGKRTTGSAASRFLLVGPGWYGDTPTDVYDGTFQAPTPAVMCFQRIYDAIQTCSLPNSVSYCAGSSSGFSSCH